MGQELANRLSVPCFTGAISAQVQAMLADAAELGDGITANIGATVAVSAKLGGVYTLSALKTVPGFDGRYRRNRSDHRFRPSRY